MFRNRFTQSSIYNHCPFCGNPADTQDHVPSKGFIDNIPKEGLRTIPCCKTCNNSFSLDEEYTFCAIECYVCETLTTEGIQREKVRATLNHSPKILYSIQELNKGNTSNHIKIDWERVKNTIRKNLIGHAYFELSVEIEDIQDFWVTDVNCLNKTEKDVFFSVELSKIYPEIGTRLSTTPMIITLDGQPLNYLINNWQIVDDQNYKYFVSVKDKIVKACIRNRIAAYMRFK